MGKGWDTKEAVAFDPEFWKECLRVLKPGGHLLAFGGTRMYHRLVCAIEDAGFEIRDQIQWLYGSGFPKSLDISKAINKMAGVEFKEEAASGVGFMNAVGAGGYNVTKNKLTLVGESTDEAKQWEGFGTALKPANEPICLARKPCSESTVAKNVLRWGTGALNIDASRVGDEQTTTIRNGNSGAHGRYGKDERVFTRLNPPGRWPANVVFDEEASAMLDEQAEGVSRFFYVAKPSKKEKNKGCDDLPYTLGGSLEGGNDKRKGGEDGEPQLKPTKNSHPTTKPVTLMCYLIKLVTPPGGRVLDPFMGSGTTGVAAIEEGFGFIGIEREEEYINIARARINAALEELEDEEEQEVA